MRLNILPVICLIASKTVLCQSVRIGAALPLTGSSSLQGRFTKTAYRVAIDEFNTAGGVYIKGQGFRKVELVLVDDKSSKTFTAKAVQNLIDQYQPHALLGTFGSSLSRFQSLVAKNNSLPIIFPAAATTSVVADNDWAFTTLASLQWMVDSLMKVYIKAVDEGKLPKPSKIALLWEDADHGHDFRDAVNMVVQAHPDKFQVILQESFPLEVYKTEEEFNSLAEKTRSSKADIVLVDAHQADFELLHAELVKEAYEFKALTYGARGSSTNMRDRFCNKIGGVISAQWWNKLAGGKYTPALLQKWKQWFADNLLLDSSEYLEPDDYLVGSAYEAARCVLRAINSTNSLDAAFIRDAIAASSWIDSPLGDGNFQFDANGLVYTPLIILQNSVNASTMEVLYPDNSKTTETFLLTASWTPVYYERAAAVNVLLYTLVGIITVLTIFILGVVIVHRKKNIIRIGSVPFQVVILIGGLFASVTCILFLATPDPKGMVCVATVWFAPMVVVFILGSILAKTWRVAVIFGVLSISWGSQKSLNRTAKRVSLPNSTLFIILGIAALVFIVIDIVWMAYDPPHYQVIERLGVRYHGCSLNIGFTWAAIGLSLGMLAFGTLLAWKVRDLPNAFNESKPIAGSIYNIAMFSIVMAVLEVVTKDDESVLTAMRVLLTCVSVLSVEIFFFAKPVFYALTGKEMEKAESFTGSGVRSSNQVTVRSHIDSANSRSLTTQNILKPEIHIDTP